MLMLWSFSLLGIVVTRMNALYSSIRATGDYAWSYWIMISCNVISPQVYWFKKLRRNVPLMFIISIFVNIGMWFERFTIISTSLHHDYLPSSWGYYSPTWVEISIFHRFIWYILNAFLAFCEIRSNVGNSGN
jgi:hypothetical protein